MTFSRLTRRKVRPLFVRPLLECLEDRTVPTTVTVTGGVGQEGDFGGSNPIPLTTTLSSPLSVPLQLGYYTTNGTAVQGTNFTVTQPNNQVPTIAAGSTSETFAAAATVGNNIYNSAPQQFTAQAVDEVTTGLNPKVVQTTNPNIALPGGEEPVQAEAWGNLYVGGPQDLVSVDRNSGDATVLVYNAATQSYTSYGLTTSGPPAANSIVDQEAVTVGYLWDNATNSLSTEQSILISNYQQQTPALGGRSISSAIYWFENTSTTATPHFVLKQLITLDNGTEASSLAIADMNGDGYPDIAAACYGDNYGGVWGAGSTYLGPWGTSGGDPSKVVLMLYNHATGLFLDDTPQVPGGEQDIYNVPQDVILGNLVVADVNHDGTPDLILGTKLASGADAAMQNEFTVLYNNIPAGTMVLDTVWPPIPGAMPGWVNANFTATNYVSGGTGPTEVAVGDLNGDGYADIVVANQGSASVSIFMNPGAVAPGIFNSPLAAAPLNITNLIQQPDLIAINDLNDDGRPDISVTSNQSPATAGEMDVLLNITPTGTPGTSQPTFFTHLPAINSGTDNPILNLGFTPQGIAWGQVNGVWTLASTNRVGTQNEVAFFADTNPEVAINPTPGTATIADDDTPRYLEILSAPGGTVLATENLATGLVTGTQSLTTIVGTAFPNLYVETFNAADHPVGNVPVTFTAPTVGPSGTFSTGASTTVTTYAGGWPAIANPNPSTPDFGVAMLGATAMGPLPATPLTANTTANTSANQFWSLNVSVPGMAKPLPFFLMQNQPAAPAELAFLTQPTTGSPNTALVPAIVVELEDKYGNFTWNYAGAPIPVTLTLAANPGNSTLSGGGPVASGTLTNSFATFSNVSLNNPGTGYRLQASAPGLTSALSNPFGIRGPAKQFTSTLSGTILVNTWYSVTVSTLDANGYAGVLPAGASTPSITAVAVHGTGVYLVTQPVFNATLGTWTFSFMAKTVGAGDLTLSDTFNYPTMGGVHQVSSTSTFVAVL